MAGAAESAFTKALGEMKDLTLQEKIQLGKMPTRVIAPAKELS